LLLSALAAMSQLTAAHQDYIQTKVNPTLETLVTQVLMERPEKPVPFMIRWLAEQTKAPSSVLDTGEAEGLRSEIIELQAEVRELEQRLNECGEAAASTAASLAAPAAAGPAADEEEEEEEDDDDLLEPPPEMKQSTGPRSSVSAEAYGDWNKKVDFTPPVHAKTEDQTSRLQAVLKQSFLFSALEQPQLDIIIGAMVEKPISSGDRIMKEGDDGEVMFVIEKGAVDCIKFLDGVDKVVKTCGPGDVFGELALLYNCPRAATVKATEETILWELDRNTFNHIVRDASMKKREMYEEFLKCVPLLESLGQYEKSQIADALCKETVPAGAVVFKQGDEGSRFYIVEEGQLVVRKNSADGSSSQDVLTYTRGGYFGELALMRDDTRAASVIAATEAKLLYLERKTFKSLLGPIEDVLKKKASDYN